MTKYFKGILTVLSITSVYLSSFNASAQNWDREWRLGLMGSPLLSKISAPPVLDFHATGTAMYGLEASLQYGDFMWSSGLVHLQQGTYYLIEKTSPSHPSGTGESFNQHVMNHTLAVPLIFEYRLWEFRGASAWFGGGTYLGYMYEEYYRPSFGTEPQFFDDFYAAGTLGVKGRWEFNHRWSLQFRPAFTHQIRWGSDSRFYTPRLWFVSAEVGLHYTF